MKAFVILPIVLTIAFSYSLFSQTSEAIISGFVTDAKTGEVLIGSNLLLFKDSLSTSQSPIRGTSTNNFGFYAILAIKSVNYVLLIRNVGYKTTVKEIKVDSSIRMVRLNVELVLENIKIDEIVVIAEKDKVSEVSTIDISSELLSKLPSLSGEVDVFKSLQLVPGVKVASE